MHDTAFERCIRQEGAGRVVGMQPTYCRFRGQSEGDVAVMVRLSVVLIRERFRECVLPFGVAL
jgi:hypothetical protein